MTDEELAAIEARWNKATAGPWLWAGSNNSLELMAARGWGDVVMAFRRWGMQGAQPAFVIDGLIYDVAKGRRGKSLLIRPEAHNSWKIRGIDHPDAIAIAAAPTDIATLLAEIKRLGMENEQLRGQVQRLYDQHGTFPPVGYVSELKGL